MTQENRMQTIQEQQKVEYYLVLCSCGTPEHQLILEYSPDDEDKTCYINVHLTHWEGFFRRLWSGLRYAFNYRSRYGEFDEICIDERGALGLSDFLLKFADQEQIISTTNSDSVTCGATWTVGAGKL